jgi:Domain of Unknown Function (DUF1080)
VARHGPIIGLGRPFGDVDHVRDPVLALPDLPRWPPHRTTSPQTPGQFVFQGAAGLHIQRLVDGFSAQLHLRPIGKLDLQPARDLLRGVLLGEAAGSPPFSSFRLCRRTQAILEKLSIQGRGDTGATVVHEVTPRRYQPRHAANEPRRTMRFLEWGRSGRWLGVGAACTVLLLAVIGAFTYRTGAAKSEGTLLAEDFATLSPGEQWRDGEEYGQWRADYAGYGATTIVVEGGRHQLSMSPGVPSEADTTHGSLVTTLKQFDDIDVTAQLRTDRQLRPQTPNPWEVAWLVWHYTDDHHFYSIVLKPNGWELGKEDPEYPGSQRFLATGTTPLFPIGVVHTVRVRHVGNEISVWANGALLTIYRDVERPYQIGSIGLYTEDAHVYFDSVVVRRP